MTQTADSLADSGTRAQLDALAERVGGVTSSEYGTKTELAAAILAADPDAEIAPDATAPTSDDEPIMNVDGKTPQLDFTVYEDAVRQAEILGGAVEHRGVAFSVVTD